MIAPTYYGNNYQPAQSVLRSDPNFSRSHYLRGPVSHELDETLRQKRFHQSTLAVQESQIKQAEERTLYNSRQLEKHLDWHREEDLASYYKPSNRFYANPWLAPWVFPDGTPCFYCRGAGFRADIGLPGLPCRGCGNENYLKPSRLIDAQCVECNGDGVWKETYCTKCGGKGLGPAYLPFKCPAQCGARTRTNWEIELHCAIAHGPRLAPRPPTAAAPSPAAALATAPLNQPFVLPFGKKWFPKEFPKDYSYRENTRHRRQYPVKL